MRARRKALGMNQSTLAQKLGVTFQMIQRYEYGLCRISASTLYAMACALEAPMSYFFDGLPLPAAKRFEPAPSERFSLELAKTHYGRTLAELFPQINPPRQPARDRRAGCGRWWRRQGRCNPSFCPIAAMDRRPKLHPCVKVADMLIGRLPTTENQNGL